MSVIPQKFVCDIENCDKESPKTSTGKRDYLQVHFARTTRLSEDRLTTLDEPVLDTVELDLCPEHFKQYVAQLPITGGYGSSTATGVIYRFKEQHND